MINVKNLYDFELENGQIVKNDDKQIVLLTNELMKENFDKIRNYYKNYFSGCSLNDVAEGIIYIKRNNKIGALEQSGKILFPFKYDLKYTFCEELALVSKDGLFGYINKKGEEVIPCQYKDAGYFCEGMDILIKKVMK